MTITNKEYQAFSTAERENFIKEQFNLDDDMFILAEATDVFEKSVTFKNLKNFKTDDILSWNGIIQQFSKVVLRIKISPETPHTINENHWYVLKVQVADSVFSINSGQPFEVESVVSEISKTNAYLKKYNAEVKDDETLGFLFNRTDTTFSYFSNEEAIDMFLTEEKKFLQFDREMIDNDAADLAEQKAELVEKELAFQEQQADFEALIKEISVCKERMQRLGFFVDADENVDESDKERERLPEDTDTWLPLIQNELAKRGFYYSIDTIRLFFTALHTQELIILTGPSGTGKTSIVEQMADIFDAECEIIPVQSSWHDSQDLLGFYNPLTQQYSATPFVDVLVEANKAENRDKLYFICLDELNLANVEYYLADILSVRESDKNEVRLYSDSEQQKNQADIKLLKPFIEDQSIESIADIQNLKLDVKYFAELLAREKNMHDYRASIPFPDNVRIIGTMNIEGLVNPLSPKIVDRSFIIPIEEKIDPIETFNNEVAHYHYLFNEKRYTSVHSEVHQEFIKFIKQFENINIQMSARTEKHILDYTMNAVTSNLNTAVDDVLLTKILPKIHLLKDDFEEQAAHGIGFPVDNGVSKQKFDTMLANVDKHRLLSFWTS